MGPSGSGKSTLMNVLGCLDIATTGTYHYQGIAVETLNADQRSLLRRYALGFIFQGFNLLARTSAQDNVELPLLYRGISRKERHGKALAALTSVGLATKLRSTRANSPAASSSGSPSRAPSSRSPARSLPTNRRATSIRSPRATSWSC
jgi:putative ABC transport system ATP-binding protein